MILIGCTKDGLRIKVYNSLLLDKVSQDIIDSVLSVSPNKVLILDKLFKGNDQLKTNTKLQMDDAGIKFKTI